MAERKNGDRCTDFSAEIGNALLEAKNYTLEKIDAARRISITILGVVGIILGIAAFFSIDEMINRSVDAALKKQSSLKLTEEIESLAERSKSAYADLSLAAEQANAKLTDQETGIQETIKPPLQDLQRQVNELRDGQNSLKKRNRATRSDVRGAGKDIRATKGIETYLYELEIPEAHGQSRYATRMSTEEFPSAIVGSVIQGGEDCGVGGVEVFLDHRGETWTIDVYKERGCTWLELVVVYVPDALVKRSRRAGSSNRLD